MAPREIKIYLTGFGAFAGVDENPTQLIIGQLKKEQEENRCSIIHGLDIIETSIQGVDAYFSNLKLDDSIHVFLHLGVSGMSIMYELEGGFFWILN